MKLVLQREYHVLLSVFSLHRGHCCSCCLFTTCPFCVATTTPHQYYHHHHHTCQQNVWVASDVQRVLIECGDWTGCKDRDCQQRQVSE